MPSPFDPQLAFRTYAFRITMLIALMGALGSLYLSQHGGALHRHDDGNSGGGPFASLTILGYREMAIGLVGLGLFLLMMAARISRENRDSAHQKLRMISPGLMGAIERGDRQAAEQSLAAIRDDLNASEAKLLLAWCDHAGRDHLRELFRTELGPLAGVRSQTDGQDRLPGGRPRRRSTIPPGERP
jgi:hypothetical protein